MAKLSNKAFTALWPYLVLLCAATILLYPVVISREATFCTGYDNLHQSYPFLVKLCTSLHKGYLPVWDANTFGGKSFAGEIQPGIFYPLNILWCFLFGTARGIDVYYLDLLVSFHFLIALVGMYKVARVFSLPPFAAIASALVFAFTGAVAGRSWAQTGIFYGLCLLPWVIYFIARYYCIRRNKIYFVIAGLLAGMEILAGHMQPFFHTLVISGMMIIFYEYQDRKDWLSFVQSAGVACFILVFFALLISLPQLYYSAQYLSNCYRSVSGGQLIAPGQKVPLDIYAHMWIVTPANWANLLGRDFNPPGDANLLYMGILPLMLVIVYLARIRVMKVGAMHVQLSKLLILMLLFGVLSVVAYLTFFHLILYSIPFVNGVRQLGRYAILISFSASLLVGLSLTYIQQLNQFSRISYNCMAALGINLLYLVLFQQAEIPAAVTIPFLLGVIFLAALRENEVHKWLTLLAVVFIFADLFLNKVKFESTDTALYPARFYGRNRLIDSLEKSYGTARVTFDMKNADAIRQNLGDVFAIQTKFGFGATFYKPYLDFLNSKEDNGPKIDDLLNVRYVLSDHRLDSAYTLLDSVRHQYLYQRRNYYSRVYWQHQLGERGEQIETENKGRIIQMSYSDLYQKYTVECLSPDILIFSENAYPGWRCRDNGVDVPIFHATIGQYPAIFRSIRLDKGRHNIEFVYNKVFHWF